MRASWSVRVASWMGALVGCGGAAPEPLGVLSSGILGGFLAPSPELDHTGAMIRIDRATGRRSIICTATAIGPESAVTAKHCVRSLEIAVILGDEAAWVAGPDIETQAEPNLIVGVEQPAESPEPGALGLGFDVAVVHLADPVAATAVPREYLPSLLGRSMVTLGFGMAGASSPVDGRRRIGRETVVAVDGLVYEALYGNFESYFDAQRASGALAGGGASPSSDADSAWATYHATRLIPAHEVVTATLPGNTRSCRGDSGGPLLQMGEQGEWEVFGVLSGGPSSERAECDWGEIFSTFGPFTHRFVDAASTWTDPCGALDERGECAGGVARWCETDVLANGRRPVEDDCSRTTRNCSKVHGTARCVARSTKMDLQSTPAVSGVDP